MARGGRIDFLQELTFVNALGASGRQEIDIPQSWDKYDFILFVPDLMITAQEGQTNGNWLWYEIRNKTTNVTQGNYDGDSGVGAREMGRYTAIVSKGEMVNSGLRFMMSCWISGRIASIPATTDEKFSDLKITYGTYYGGTYGLLNGTVKIYGAKFE